jgi:hypothetical protein
MQLVFLSLSALVVAAPVPRDWSTIETATAIGASVGLIAGAVKFPGVFNNYYGAAVKNGAAMVAGKTAKGAVIGAGVGSVVTLSNMEMQNKA